MKRKCSFFSFSFLMFLLFISLGKGQATDLPISPPETKRPISGVGAGSGPGSLLGSSDTLLFTGSFTHTIPLEVPPGTHGLQPNVVLSYNSSNGNGWCGQGWDLSFGIIQRSTKNGVPKYDNTDTFVFSSGGSSQELVSTGNNEYRSKIDSNFMKFVHYPDSVIINNDIWIAYDKSGARYVFGHGWDESAKVVKPNTTDVFSWALSSVIDTNHNEIYFFYTHNQNQIYPSWIQYSHHLDASPPMRKVEFTLEDRSDPNVSYRSGFAITTAKRLKSIETFVNAEQVIKYELSYTQSFDTDRSLLNGIQVKKGASSLPKTWFYYQYIESPWLVSPSSWTQAGTDNSFYFTDFNSDGKVDLANNISGSAGLNVYFSTGTGLNASANNPWLPSTVSGDFYFVDFDGNGYVDVGVGETINNVLVPPTYKFKVWCSNNGQGLTSSSEWLSIYPALNVKPQFGDFNGDGKTDLARGTDARDGLMVYLTKNDGTGFDTPFTQLLTGSEGEYFLFDFNGDSKTDVARRTTDNSNGKTGLHVWFSTGTSFEDKGIWISDNVSTYKLYFFDVNGDGLLDVTQFSYASDHKLNVYLNTGNYSAGSGLIYKGSYPLNDSTKDIYLGDLNGDGLTDIGMNNTENDPNAAGLLVWFNTGEGFISKGLWTSAGTGPRRFQLYDFNGDGKTDISWYISEEGSGAAGLNVQLAGGPIPNLMSKITNGLGGQTSVTYTPSTEYINRLLPFAIPVVSNIFNNDLYNYYFKQDYEYKNGYYDVKAKEFLGFGEVKTKDAQGNHTVTKFLQEDERNIETEGSNVTYVNPYKGKILFQKSYSGDSSTGTLMAVSISTYTCTDAATGGAVTGATRWYFPQLTKTRTTTYDGNVEKTTGANYTFDSYGNLITTVSLGDAGNNNSNTDDDLTTTISYSPYTYQYDVTDSYTVNIPFSQETSDTTKIISKIVMTYDTGGHGNMMSKITGPDGGPKATISMTYDVYGNIFTVTDANENAAIGTGNIVTTTYDSDYQTFPIKVTNSLNHEASATYDPGTGNIVTETDANEQTTTYEYDTFGRLIKVYSPIDNTGYPSMIYTYNDIDLPRSVYVQNKEVGEADGDTATVKYLDTWQFYDGLGRIAQTQSQNTTKWSYHVISDLKDYNTRGLVSKSYTPFLPDHQTYPGWVAGQFYGNSPTVPYYATTSYTYDALGRVIKQDLSDGTFSTVSFSGWTETRTDPKGKSSVYEKDAFGRIIKVTEHNNSQNYITQYTYDTLGNLKTITNALSETTTINYDSLGRKINMNDPKMGYWQYSYDANGNLISQTDAKSQTTTLTYDRLSRITGKSGDGQITYEYDTGQYGKGRLAKVTYPDGYKQFTYDKIGRVISSEEGIKDGANTKVYITGSEYNASGQQTKLNYPATEEITYGYNSSGDLLTVGDNVSDFVKQTEYNQNKQIIQMDFNNNLTTAYEYNWNNLRLTKLITGNTSNFTFTDPTYISYDCKDHTAFREFLKSLEVQP